jgi:hypothetical protein
MSRRRFSIGVPVRTSRFSARISRAALAALESGFLICCPSSRIIASQRTWVSSSTFTRSWE